MKKTYNINLNGQVFCIDDDACLKLQSYIDTLESHYLKEEDGREIMADIESRIAELLKEALGIKDTNKWLPWKISTKSFGSWVVLM